MSDTVSLDALDKPGPLHPAATPEQDALLRWAEAHKIERNSPPVSRGHYRPTDPVTGKTTGFLRMSSLAKTLSDQTAISRWEKANIIRGLRADPEILARIDDDSDAAKVAGKRGGDYLKADLGTAMHTGVEVWSIDPLAATDLPAPWDKDLDAIVAALQRHGITPDPDWIEAVMIHPELEAAGRLDFLASGPWGPKLRVCDLKTGRTDFGVTDWAAQLAGYATSPMRWRDGVISTIDPELIDKETGIIVHAQLGAGECHIYEIDLVRGRELLQACYEARVSRRGSKDLMTPHMPPTPDVADDGLPAEPEFHDDNEPTHIAESLSQVVDDLEARTDQWLAGRIAALNGNEQAMRVVLLAWDASLPATPPWTAEQRSKIEAALGAGEAAIGAPFPAPRPVEATPPPEPVTPKPQLRPTPDHGGLVDVDVCDAVADEVKGLDESRIAQFMAWQHEAKTAGRPWIDMIAHKPWSARTHAAVVAMAACLTHLWDDDHPDTLTRAALRVVLGDDAVQTSFTTGGLLGTLTSDEARQLTQIANAFGRGDTATIESLGLAVA